MCWCLLSRINGVEVRVEDLEVRSDYYPEHASAPGLAARQIGHVRELEVAVFLQLQPGGVIVTVFTLCVPVTADYRLLVFC